MACMAVSDDFIIVGKGLYIDCYNYLKHYNINIPTKLAGNDFVSAIEISPNGKQLAIITSTSKQLLIYDLPLTENHRKFLLPRSASRIRFTSNNDHVLVADKSGDVLIFDIGKEDSGSKLLGHLSLLLDVLQTDNGKHIITSDRDEKIRVSCYPNTYNIETYCLGHKEFVNHLEIMPHNEKILISTSGDGTIKCWDYVRGTMCYSIDTYIDVNNDELKDEFIKTMDKDGVEVDTLPIVHYSNVKLNDSCSLMAVAVLTFNTVLIYRLQTINQQLTHNLEKRLPLEKFPACLKFHKSSLYVLDDVVTDCCVHVYNICNNGNISLQLDNKIKMLENKCFGIKESHCDSIKMLYKRRFDNVQEYQERKRQRLEKKS